MLSEDLALSLLFRSYTGDREAYAELLGWIETHCLMQLKSGLRGYQSFPQELRQDITQEVLLTFHQTHQTFDTTRSLFPWINSIIRHKTIDFIRRKDFRVIMAGVDIDVIKDTWESEDDMDPVEADEILKLLQSLPAKQAEILKLSKIEGFSNKEIARELHMTESNVKVSVFRALKVLKSLAPGKK